MPNRDHEDSQYNRNEGRFESRDEGRDQSNAGSREWDRRGGEFRQQEQYGRGSTQQRGYQPSSFEERLEQRLAQQDLGRGGYSHGQDYRSQQGYGENYGRQQGSFGSDYDRQGSYGQDYRSRSDYDRQGSYGQDYRSSSGHDWGHSQGHSQGYGQEPRGHDWRSQDWNTQSSQGPLWRSQEWNRPQSGFGTGRGQDYGRTQSGGYGQDWDHSPSYRQDFSRTQSNYGGRDAFRTQQDYGSGSWGSSQGYGGGQYRGDQDNESWGQQIRHAGQQAARSIKRAFRGPKGYRRSDERIREDVSDRLGLQDALDPSEIEVSVTNGEVTLTGTVQSRAEKYAAEEIADDVSGVTEVNNQLRVRREDGSSTMASTTTGGSTTSTQNESTLRNRNARA